MRQIRQIAITHQTREIKYITTIIQKERQKSRQHKPKNKVNKANNNYKPDKENKINSNHKLDIKIYKTENTSQKTSEIKQIAAKQKV